MMVPVSMMSYLDAAMMGMKHGKNFGGGGKGGKGKGKGGVQNNPTKRNRWSKHGQDPAWECHKCGLEHHDPRAPKCCVCGCPRKESERIAALVKAEGAEKDRQIQSLQDKLKAAENRSNAQNPPKKSAAASTPDASGASDGNGVFGSLSSLVASDAIQPRVPCHLYSIQLS